jgi:hypothetical protein
VDEDADVVLEVPLSDPRLHWTRHGATIVLAENDQVERYASGIDVCEWTVLQLQQMLETQRRPIDPTATV